MSTVELQSSAGGRSIELPPSRGPWSGELFSALRDRAPGEDLHLDALPVPEDPLGDDDLQLALYVAYELHYSGCARPTNAGSGRRRCSASARPRRSCSERRSTRSSPSRRPRTSSTWVQ